MPAAMRLEPRDSSGRRLARIEIDERARRARDARDDEGRDDEARDDDRGAEASACRRSSKRVHGL